MTPDESFLRAILDQPDDDAPRLMYADWLTERGDPQGEFIRIQCRLASPDICDDPACWVLLARQAQLLREHGKHWAGPVRRFVKRWRFRRGFVEWVAMTPEAFLRHGQSLLDVSPLHTVRVLPGPSSTAPRELSGVLLEMQNCPHLARLRGLDVSGFVFEPRAFSCLFLSRYAPRLEYLRAEDTPLFRDSSFPLLATVAERTRLTELSLSRGHGGEVISGKAMGMLVNSPHLGQLTRLSLGCGMYDLSLDAVSALVASPLLGQLTELAIGAHDGTARLWGASPSGQLLRRLLTSPRLANLRVLRLRQGGPGVAWLEGLLTSPHLANLRRLDLQGCLLGKLWARNLAAARPFPHLAHLGLARCWLRDEGLLALARAPSLPRLAALNLDENGVGSAAVRDFARSFLTAQLR